MPASRRALVVALACLSNFSLSCFAAAQESDQVVAERIPGPQWKQISRRAGMIFAGTVLAGTTRTATDHTAATDRALTTAVPAATPAVQLSLRVDRAIAGVELGQILTISRVGRSTVRASPDAQRPAHSDPLRSAESLGLYQPSGWIPPPDRARPHRQGTEPISALVKRLVSRGQTKLQRCWPETGLCSNAAAAGRARARVAPPARFC
jgi:hypothetical protein